METAPQQQPISLMRRLAGLLMIAGSAAIVVYGTTPFAALLASGSLLLLLEPYLERARAKWWSRRSRNKS